MDPCHIVPKQTLKVQFSDLEPEQLSACLYDPRNGVPGCRSFHGRFDGGHLAIKRSQLPADALAFVDDWNLDWWLDKHFGEVELSHG